MGCRWHDARIGPGSKLLQNNRRLQGALIPYMGNPRILVCKIGARANKKHGCHNTSPVIGSFHSESDEDSRFIEASGSGLGHENIPIIPQYTYTMNGHLYRRLDIAASTGTSAFELNAKTLRRWQVRRETQVMRSPSDVFVFGEENSWTVSGEQYTLSGLWPGLMDNDSDFGSRILGHHEFTGTLTLGGLDIGPSYVLSGTEDDGYQAKRVCGPAGRWRRLCDLPPSPQGQSKRGTLLRFHAGRPCPKGHGGRPTPPEPAGRRIARESSGSGR